MVEDPYDDMSNVEVAIAIATRKERLKIPTDCDPRLQFIMKGKIRIEDEIEAKLGFAECFKEDPNERPDFSKILAWLDDERSSDNIMTEPLAQRVDYSSYPDLGEEFSHRMHPNYPDINDVMQEKKLTQREMITMDIEDGSSTGTMDRYDTSYPEFSEIVKNRNLLES